MSNLLNTIGESPISFADYQQFERNTENFRQNLDYPELKDSIEKLGGIIDPLLCIPHTNPENPQVLYKIIEGNRRHYNLENLVKDGSEINSEIPFILLTEKLANDPLTLNSLQISFGNLDKRISLREKWQGIIDSLPYAIKLAQNEDPRFEKVKKLLDANKKDKAEDKAKLLIAEAYGISPTRFYQLRAVFECDYPEIVKWVDNEELNVTAAGEVVKALKNNKELANISVTQLLEESADFAMDEGRITVKSHDVRKAVERLTTTPTESLVENSLDTDQAISDSSSTQEEKETRTFGELKGLAANVHEDLDIVVSFILDAESEANAPNTLVALLTNIVKQSSKIQTRAAKAKVAEKKKVN
jgi:hypothetical protein